MNLPVPPGSGDEAWVSLVEHVVRPLARAYAPELVLVSAGYDAHADDPLASCAVTDAGFEAMAASARLLAEEAGAPLGIVLEGGYDLGALSRCFADTLEVTAGRRGAARRTFPCTRSPRTRSRGWRRAGPRSRPEALRRGFRGGRASSWSVSSRRLRRPDPAPWRGGTVAVVGSVVAPGVVATELVTGGVVVAGGVTPSAGAGAEVVATAGGASFVSSTNATASAAPASATMIASSAAGMCQLGVGARRVRAGAPHSRHQS